MNWKFWQRRKTQQEEPCVHPMLLHTESEWRRIVDLPQISRAMRTVRDTFAALGGYPVTGRITYDRPDLFIRVTTDDPRLGIDTSPALVAKTNAN